MKWLQAQVTVIKAEQAEAATQVAQSTSRATSLDIRTAALEVFFDKYAAGVGVVIVIVDEVERLAALKLVPRREERRGKSEDGGGTGSSDRNCDSNP